MQVEATAVLETLRERQLLPATCRAVLLVGSAARGWSNRKSDIDLNLICDEAWAGADSVGAAVPLQPAEVRIESFYADGRRWELKYWLDDQVGQILAKVSWNEFDQDRAAGEMLVTYEEAFLERLATCVPLAGEEWLTRRRAELDASAFRAVMVTRSLGAADGLVEDALGQLADGDLVSAVLSARLALGHAVDALLEERGQYGSYTPKWRARRFQTANPAVLSFADYWKLETMQDFDPDDPTKWITKVLTLCQDISLKTEI